MNTTNALLLVLHIHTDCDHSRSREDSSARPAYHPPPPPCFSTTWRAAAHKILHPVHPADHVSLDVVADGEHEKGDGEGMGKSCHGDELLSEKMDGRGEGHDKSDIDDQGEILEENLLGRRTRSNVLMLVVVVVVVLLRQDWRHFGRRVGRLSSPSR